MGSDTESLEDAIVGPGSVEAGEDYCNYIKSRVSIEQQPEVKIKLEVGFATNHKLKHF